MDASTADSSMNPWWILLDSSSICTICSAVGLVILATYRSRSLDELFRKNNDLEELSLKTSTVLMIPIFGSLGLVLFFYYFSIVAYISAIFACLVSSVGMVFAVYPLFSKIFTKLATNEFNVPLVGKVPILCILLYPLAVSLIILWLMTGHWALNNLIGGAITVMAICFVRIPNLKIASIFLGGLFLYDIFWVFFSSHFFGKNVMVTVATNEATNPVAALADTLNIPQDTFTPTLQLPMKLIWGDLMLGLGDIVTPGFLISFAARFDRFKGISDLTYFHVSIVGYTVGLLLSMIFAFVYNSAQPALLYLVPSVLLPLFALSFKRGEFSEIWQSNGEDQDVTNVTAKYQD